MEDWSKGLQQRGVFFEGWVENLDQVLESHRKATVTSYGTRRSSKTSACNNKENDKPQSDGKMKTSPKIYWSIGQMNRDDTPFSIVETKTLDCKDWLRHQLPCKHFFAVFQYRKEWQWEQLPSKYLKSAYLPMDVDSIRCHFQQRSEPTVCNDTKNDTVDTMENVVGDLPLRKQNVSINSAAERVRITLKEIDTLTYACPSADDLILLDEQLKTIKSAFQDKLPSVEGLVIRPAVVDRAHQTKKKYAHIKARMRLQKFSALKESNRQRHKGSSSYQNRVGIRKEAAKKADAAPSSPPGEIESATSKADVQKPVKPIAGKKRSRCGECEGSLVEEDCGHCHFCADKPKFGRPGRKKQCCAKRKCSLLSTTKSGKTTNVGISQNLSSQICTGASKWLF